MNTTSTAKEPRSCPQSQPPPAPGRHPLHHDRTPSTSTGRPLQGHHRDPSRPHRPRATGGNVRRHRRTTRRRSRGQAKVLPARSISPSVSRSTTPSAAPAATNRSTTTVKSWATRLARTAPRVDDNARKEFALADDTIGGGIIADPQP